MKHLSFFLIVLWNFVTFINKLYSIQKCIPTKISNLIYIISIPSISIISINKRIYSFLSNRVNCYFIMFSIRKTDRSSSSKRPSQSVVQVDAQGRRYLIAYPAPADKMDPKPDILNPKPGKYLTSFKTLNERRREESDLIINIYKRCFFQKTLNKIFRRARERYYYY